MKILFINQYVACEDYCPSTRPVYLAREWTKLGHEVTIASGSFSHLFHDVPSFPGTRLDQIRDDVRYVMFKTPMYQGNGVGRVASIFAFTAQLKLNERWLAKEVGPDLVIAGSVHGLDSLPARSLARRRGAKFVRDVRDLWPLTVIEMGGVAVWHPFVKLLQWAEDFSYKRADGIVTTLPNSFEHMRRHGLAAGKWSFVPQGVDIADWEKDRMPLPDLHASTLRRLRTEGRFIVGYAGGHGEANSLDTLIDAARMLKERAVAFVLVGQGPEKERLQGRVTGLALNNIWFLPSVSKKSVPDLLNSVDAGYLGWKALPLYRFGISPNKLMDYMMASKPVIHAVDAVNDSVAESQCGISVHPEDPEAIASAVLRLMDMSPAERMAMGLRGKEFIVSRHDYRILARKYLEVMDGADRKG